MQKNKLSYYLVNISILINVCILFIPNRFKAYPILVFLLSSVYFKFKSSDKLKFSYCKILLVSGLIFIYSLSILFSNISSDVFFKLSTMASLIAYPLIFALLESSGYIISKKDTKNIYNSYVISVLFFPILSFLYLFKMKFTLSETIIHYSNLINIELKTFSIHPIYLSIYIGIALLFIIELYKNSTSKIIKGYYIISTIIMIIILGILMRRGPIIYLLISILILLIRYFNLLKVLIGIFLIVTTIILSIQFIPKYNNENRFNDLINNAFENKSKSSVGIRYNIYLCSEEKISQKPLFGYGLGNVKKELDSCFISKNMDIRIVNYNSHNQYLSILLTAGFFGFFLYLITVYKNFKIFYLKKSKLGLSVFIFFLLNFLTENVLEREHGVLLYSLIISFFIFQKEEL